MLRQSPPGCHHSLSHLLPVAPHLLVGAGNDSASLITVRLMRDASGGVPGEGVRERERNACKAYEGAEEQCQGAASQTHDEPGHVYPPLLRLLGSSPVSRHLLPPPSFYRGQ